MEHFYESLDGTFDFQGIYHCMALNCPDNGKIVEVGCNLGKSAAYMAVELINLNKTFQFDCIDAWDGRDGFTATKADFENNMLPVAGNFNAIQAVSPAAASLYADESLYFVFFDTTKSYEDTYSNIQAWLPKIQNEGWIGGHWYDQKADESAEKTVSAACWELLPGFEKIFPPGASGPSWLFHRRF